jgi:hypothetical protein
MLSKMSLCNGLFGNTFCTRGSIKTNIVVRYPHVARLLPHNGSQITHSKLKDVQTFAFSCNNANARFAAPVMASDCNLLRLQMLPR